LISVVSLISSSIVQYSQPSISKYAWWYRGLGESRGHGFTVPSRRIRYANWRSTCQAHLDELTAPAAVYANGARPSATSKRRPTKKSTWTTRGRKSVDTAAVRAWVVSEGYEIGDRGRIPASIVDAFTAKK
jgi:Lsr2